MRVLFIICPSGRGSGNITDRVVLEYLMFEPFCLSHWYAIYVSRMN